MSYLNPTRLHFAGQFQANVSTVNNDPAHFNNAAFEPDFQKMQTADSPNGWWNPEGDGNWRLIGCAITAAWVDGAPADPADPVLKGAVADSDRAVPAKLVDLDSQQQMVSQIWGLTVRITDGEGKTLVEGRFIESPFTNLWNRALGKGAGDFGMGAEWQSVLTDVVWQPEADQSAMLAQLKAASVPGMLSIKFNVDGYTMAWNQEDFSTGRIVGTIGPYLEGEPLHVVIGRHLLANYNGITPTGKVNHCAAVIDAASETMLIDLGNALPTDNPGGPLADIGDLQFGLIEPGRAAPTPFATIANTYVGSQGYLATAGIVAVETAVDIEKFSQPLPVAVFSDAPAALVSENPACSYLRADQFVYRLAPSFEAGDDAQVTFHAMQFGAPLAHADIVVALDSSMLSPDPGDPPTCTPTGALSFPTSVTTDAQGTAQLTIAASDPGTPRNFNGDQYGIDGQVYGVRASFADPALAAGPVNIWDFISLLVHSAWKPAGAESTWADIQPIMQQYANLYPVMNRFLDLGNPNSIKGNLYLLKLAFELPMDNPNHMPVTRDLSPAKRAAILAVLDAMGTESAAGEAIPRPPVRANDRGAAKARALGTVAAEGADSAGLGGKTAALMRSGILPQSQGDDQ